MGLNSVAAYVQVELEEGSQSHSERRPYAEGSVLVRCVRTGKVFERSRRETSRPTFGTHDRLQHVVVRSGDRQKEWLSSPPQ